MDQAIPLRGHTEMVCVLAFNPVSPTLATGYVTPATGRGDWGGPRSLRTRPLC
jgi:hypothetical protein